MTTAKRPVQGGGSTPPRPSSESNRGVGSLSVQVRVIQPGMSFGAWREWQYRLFTSERYRALIVDLGIRRIELRRRVA